MVLDSQTEPRCCQVIQAGDVSNIFSIKVISDYEVNSIHSLKRNVLLFILIILVENFPSHDSTEGFSLKLRLFILCSYAAELF